MKISTADNGTTCVCWPLDEGRFRLLTRVGPACRDKRMKDDINCMEEDCLVVAIGLEGRLQMKRRVRFAYGGLWMQDNNDRREENKRLVAYGCRKSTD